MSADAVTAAVVAVLFSRIYPTVPVPNLYSVPDHVYPSSTGLILYTKLAESNIKSAISFEEEGGCVPNGRAFSVLDITSIGEEYKRNLDSTLDDAARIKKLFGEEFILPDTIDPDPMDADMVRYCSGILTPLGCIWYAVNCTLGFPIELDTLNHVVLLANVVPITGGSNVILRSLPDSNTSRFNPTLGSIVKSNGARGASRATLSLVEYNRTRQLRWADIPNNT
jgi:hypothetical protein